MGIHNANSWKKENEIQPGPLGRAFAGDGRHGSTMRAGTLTRLLPAALPQLPAALPQALMHDQPQSPSDCEENNSTEHHGAITATAPSKLFRSGPRGGPFGFRGRKHSAHHT